MSQTEPNYNLRFSELIANYESLILKEYKLVQGKLRKEELYATALIGLFFADMTYQRGLGEFSDYIQLCIRKALHYYLKSTFVRYPLLNAKIREGKTEFIYYIQAPRLDLDLCIMTADYIAHLCPNHQRIAYELMDNASIENLIEEYGLNKGEIEQILCEMRDQWIAQYGETISP